MKKRKVHYWYIKCGTKVRVGGCTVARKRVTCLRCLKAMEKERKDGE